MFSLLNHDWNQVDTPHGQTKFAQSKTQNVRNWSSRSTWTFYTSDILFYLMTNTMNNIISQALIFAKSLRSILRSFLRWWRRSKRLYSITMNKWHYIELFYIITMIATYMMWIYNGIGIEESSWYNLTVMFTKGWYSITTFVSKITHEHTWKRVKPVYCRVNRTVHDTRSWHKHLSDVRDQLVAWYKHSYKSYAQDTSISYRSIQANI